MRYIFLMFCCVLSLLAQAQLVSYTKIDSFTAEQMKERFKNYGIPKVITPTKHGVDVYEVIYKTKWHDGSLINASGIYFAPTQIDEQLPRLIYNHGTIIHPKRHHFDFNGESTICLLFATDGYSVLAPDYVGLGKGEKQHLYVHADSEADAGIYFMHAAEEIDRALGIELDGQTFISGYSQGGHATLAMHKKLQEKYPEKYPVTASSPMSGPYDLSGVQAEVMFREYTQPHYLPYLLLGYNEAYQIWPKEQFYEIFAEPYNSMVPQLFDGTNSVGDVNAALPNVPMEMLKPEFVAEWENNPDYFFKEMLAANNLHNWKPEAPVQLCYCKGDEEVLWQNAIVTKNNMEALGAKHVRLRHVGKKYNHRGCADFASIYTKYYFDSFRKGSKKGRKGPLFRRMFVSLGKLFR